MALTLNGTTGLSGIAGSAGTPALQGNNDTNTGYFFAADILGLSTAGSERLRITAAGNLALGNDGSFPIYTDTNDRNFILGTGSDDAAIQLHSGTDKFGGLYFGDATSGADRYNGYVEYKHNDNYLRFGTGGTEKIRIDSSGRLLVGHSLSIDQHSIIQSFTTSTDTFAGFKYGDNAAPNIIRLGKSRNASIGGNTIVADDDEIGRIGFVGADGSDFQDCAAIQCFVDGAPSNGTDMPGRLVLSTTSDNSGSLTSRLTIDSGGFVGFGTTSPRRHFHIHNSASATVGMMLTNGNTGEADDSQGFQFKVGSDSHAEIAQLENSYIQILTNGSNAMRITNDQKVGIGTTNPTSTTHLKSHDNGWVGGLLLEEQNATTGWNIHPDNNDHLMIGRNTDTTGTSATHIASFTTNGIRLPAGKGINFSAYADGTGDPTSNLLDDYEEGYWDLGCNVTLHTSYDRGWYVKVGHMVTCGAYVQSDDSTGNSDALTFTLPFATSAAPVGGDTGWIGSCSLNSFALDASITQSSIAAGDATSTATIRLNGGHAVSWTSMRKDQFVDGKLMQFTLTYKCVT